MSSLPFSRMLVLLFGLLCLALPCRAQFPSWLNSANLTTVQSPLDSSITISYTKPVGVCTTVFDDQEQIAGWVNVPGGYQTNIFFWFVAARDDTSMLSVYLNGGPGSSSMFGMFAEAGPCEVVEISDTQLGTAARKWGWDRASNMLFIDQPNQVGFSYDTPTNGTLDLYNNSILFPAQTSPESDGDFLVHNGTFASQNANYTANTTTVAARAVYHMMQGFLTEFPQYNPPSNSSLGVNLFAESYGGHYGSAFAAQWQTENARRRNSTAAAASTVDIHLASLGLINGCVDDLVQGPYYASMLVNNSYGFRAVPTLQASLVNASFYASGGCQELILACRAAVNTSDPSDAGTSSTANSACAKAQSRCTAQMLDPYGTAGRSYYDIAHELPESFPPSYFIDYLNSAAVQSAIGSPVNFTMTSTTVYDAFVSTGDFERGSNLVSDIASLLKSGVRVGLVYGDRDFICNWLGGEALSLAVAESAGGQYADRFPAAGYAPIIVNDSYIGGVVRQFANLSFSRIYQAGHFVPAYQPESAFQVFARIILGTDVGTGEVIDLTDFNTTGSANATSSLSLPDSPSATCYVWNLPTACNDAQISSLHAGDGVVINGVWYSASSDWPGPATDVLTPASATATAVGQVDTSTITAVPTALLTLTGVYTATATPAAANIGHAVPSVQLLAGLSFVVCLFTGFGVELLSMRLV